MGEDFNVSLSFPHFSKSLPAPQSSLTHEQVMQDRVNSAIDGTVILLMC